jgi:hypothetical protein
VATLLLALLPTDGASAGPRSPVIDATNAAQGELAWDLSPLDAAPSPAAPRVPGYTLGAPLGAGGMGTVWRARDDATGLEVAIKVLSGAGRPLAAERFEREAQLLTRFRHPGFVAVHAWGRTPAGVAWLACELVEGQTLDQAGRALDLPGRLLLLEETARIVGAAHAAGVVHRDLKPQNILVDAHGRPKIIDFGVSVGEGLLPLSASGQFVGTPLYAAPERWSGGPDQDAPTGDVWALAAIGYELLVGQHPYPADSFMDLGKRDAPPPWPRRAEPRLSRAVARVLVRALSPRPADRPQDGRALADALAAARAGPPKVVLVLLTALALLTWGMALGVWMRGVARPRARRPAPSAAAPVGTGVAGPVATATVAAPVTAVAAVAAPAPDLEAAARALAARDPTSALTAAGEDASEAGVLLRAEALALLERWGEARALLSRPLPAGARRLRGVCALYGGGTPEEVEADLGAADPHRALALALRPLGALSERPGRGVLQLASLSAAVLDEAERLALDEPGGRAGRRRAQAALCETLAGVRIPTDDELAARQALTDRCLRLLDEPAGAGGLEALRWWHEWACAPRDAGREWLLAHPGLWPAAGAWREGQPDLVQAVVGVVDLTRLGLDRPAGPDDLRAALERARGVAERLVGRQRAGDRLARVARRILLVAEREEAVLLLRANQEGWREAVGRALAQSNLIDAERGRTPDDVALRAGLFILQGRFAGARQLLASVERTTPGRLLLAECALAEGALDEARRHLEALAAGHDEVSALELEGHVLRLELHRSVLAGERAPDAARALVVDDPPGLPLLDPLRLGWHSTEGLLDVLGGGAWPGRRGGRGK